MVDKWMILLISKLKSYDWYRYPKPRFQTMLKIFDGKEFIVLLFVDPLH